MLPKSQETMLKNRQFIGIIATIVEEALDQRMFNRRAHLADWVANYLFTLIARERGDQKLRGADCLR